MPVFDGMFDTVAGLPLHPLAVHAVVVLLPLTAVATIAVALYRRWRPAAGPVAVVAGLLVPAAFVAKQSGETLQRRLSSFSADGTVVAADHGQKGSLVPLVALALFVAALGVWLAGRRPALDLPAVVLAVVVGLGAIGWTVVVGDSGARAVWGSVAGSTTESTTGSLGG
jgi:hypothetical protein